MKTLGALIKRNVKLFFKDKAMFFTSLITPAILLVLYVTFLGKIYRDSFTQSFPETFFVSEKFVNGFVGGELISSLLAVSCVTVAFCSNFLIVQDKFKGTIKDLLISPVKPTILSISYYLANLISTLIICYTATALCLIYIAVVGWYMSAGDVALMFLDVTLLTLFGNALSSVINFFLNSQGQISAVGTIVSSGYGFICGAYMPISNFSKGLQNVIACLPGTYGTSLIRNHAMNGAFNEMLKIGVPAEVLESVKDSVDCNLYFFGKQVSVGAMYAIVILTIVALLIVYILLNVLASRKNLTNTVKIKSPHKAK